MNRVTGEMMFSRQGRAALPGGLKSLPVIPRTSFGRNYHQICAWCSSRDTEGIARICWAQEGWDPSMSLRKHFTVSLSFVFSSTKNAFILYPVLAPLNAPEKLIYGSNNPCLAMLFISIKSSFYLHPVH